MQEYQYTQLAVVSEDIRLVTLLPGMQDGPIQLEIFHTPLTGVTQLPGAASPLASVKGIRNVDGDAVFWDLTTETASYSHPNLDLPLQENQPGISQYPERVEYPDQLVEHKNYLRVGRNLAEALVYLRNPRHPRTLWRNQQVTLVAWMGPSFSNADIAFSTIDYLGRQVEFTKDSWLLSRLNCEQPEWYSSVLPLPYDDETWAAIAELCSKPWFQRLWVLQEIQLGSRKSIIKCGEHEVQWSLFRRAILCIKDKTNGVRYQVRKATMEIRKTCDYAFASTLEKLLWEHTSRKLNLLPPGLAKLIKVNYSRSEGDVFEHFILARIRQTSRATWVPNWSSTMRFTVLDNFCCLANGLSAASAKSETAGILELSAIHVGNVDDIAQPLKQFGQQQLKSDAYLRAFTLRLLEDKRPGYVYPTLSTLRGAVLRLGEEEDYVNSEIDISSLYEYNIKVWLEGSCLFSTAEGHVGTTKIGVKPNDQVFVILGCNTPMILRPDQTGHHRVVGDCYLSGFMDGEAVLGQLSPEWRVVGMKGDEGTDIPYYCNSDTGAKLTEDPRLGELPPEWKPFDWVRTRDDPRYCSKFRNINTGEVINSDPRLSLDYLKQRD
ncbi:HET-domain-containing protein [Xylaria sp. FL0064]|nr:HET-domain-containing protein [Xylaria sp. FL0064]